MAGHRYWRVRSLTTIGGAALGLSEIDFWEGPFGPSALARSGWALTVSGTGSGSNPAATLVDGAVSAAVGWVSVSPESWVQIDFGAGVTVAIEKVLMWRSPQAPLETGVVEWSDDGLAWFVEWSLLLRTEDYATAPNSIAPATSTSPKSLGVSNNAPLLPRFGQVQYALDAGKEVYSDDGVTPIQDGEGVYLARNQSDYSGTGGGPADFVQASAALRPIWRSGGIRGRPFFDLDGTRYFQDIPFVQPSGFFALRAVILAAAVEGVDRTPGTFRSFLGGTASNKAEIYCRPGNPDAEYRAGQNGLQAGNYAPSTLAMALMPLSTTEAAFITDDFSEYRVTTGTNPPTAAVATAQVFRSSRLTDSGIMKGRVYEMAIVESASHVDLQITSAWIAGRQMAGAAPGPTVALVTQGQRAVWAGTAETLFRPWGIIRQRSGATLANEATIQGVVPTSGVLRRFRISIESNASTTATGHVVVRVNSQPSALAITVPPGETGVFEASLDAVVPVSAGDLLSISVKNSAASGGGLVDLRSTQIDFEPFDGIIRVVHGVSVQNNPSVNVSVADARFSPILAHSDSTVGWKASLTDRTRSPLGASGAITTATAYVRSNSLDATATFTLIKNDVETLLKLTMPSGQTGRFASVGGPVSVAPGDVFSWRREITGRTAGTIDTTSLDAVFESADGSYDLLSGTELGSTTDWTAVPVGTLGFVGFGGQIFPSPNDFGSVRLPSDSVVSRLRGRAYTSNSPADFAGFLTANGSRQSPEVMFPAGFNVDTAPWVEDVSGSATLGAGDLISLGSIAPAGGTLEQYRSPIAAGITIKLSDGPPPPPSVTPPPGLLRINGQFPTLEAGQQVSAATGLLSLSGRTPTLVEFSGVTPAIGALAFSGIAPVLAFDVELASITGALAIAGYAPGVLVGVTVATEAGQLVIEGGTPGLFTISGTIASQAAMLGLGLPPAPPAHASQAVAMALAEPPPPPTRSSQAALLALGEIVPVVAASQAAILALGHGSACVSYRCQLWTIRRRDGVVFRYTSHDQPVHRGPFVYSPCRSLDPTASENSSTLGSVGNIELTGIIDDDGIAEADLYGGLFDDAFVTVDLYSWGDQAEAPRRLAAGWTGTVSQGSTAFQMEVLGPGSRLDQQALVQMVTPACRWVFGDSRCTVKVEAMRLAGTVVVSRTRGHLFVSVPAPPAGRQWASGRIRFVTGPNAGQIVETKSVDFGLGEVVTWVSPGFLAQPGDEIELLPGCDLSRDGGCTLYANVINFGGFPDVPGSDALLETPYAKY